jgi:hypothetical protein
MNNRQLSTVKRRLAPRLMSLPGVCGVGVRSGCLAVYVVDDVERLSREVRVLIEREAPGVAFEVVIGGPFEKRGR